MTVLSRWFLLDLILETDLASGEVGTATST
jgi:hypothetical protein